MTSNPVNLPTELHELIIDELDVKPISADGWKGRKALRSCLFVSRSFRQRARSHLFRHVQLSEGGGQDYLRKRLSLLRELLTPPTNEGMLSNIRKFSILLSFEDKCGDRGSEDDDDTEDRTNKIYQVIEQHLPHILDFLFLHAHRLRHVVIEDVSDDTCSWDSFSHELCVGFLCLLRSRSLKRLELRNFTEVPNNFFDGTSITHLTTSNFHSVDPEMEFKESTSSTFPPLEFLETDQCFPLQRIVDISPNQTKAVASQLRLLKNIKLEIFDASDVNKTVCLLRAAYLAEDVFLDVDLENLENDPNPAMNLDFSQLQKLTRLTMSYSENWSASLPNLGPRSLEHAYPPLKSASPSIVFLTLRFNITPTVDVNFRYQPEPEFWKPLDDLLSGPSYPLFRLLNLQIDFGSSWRRSGYPLPLIRALAKETIILFGDALPLLSASDRLQIRYLPVD